MNTNDGVLCLENGMELPGRLFGAPVTAASIRASAVARAGSKGRDKGYGEVVFNTSMTGYQEILTDPSYYGQMVCMTYPHIGNTGVNAADTESLRPWGAGFIVHEPPPDGDEPSNWRSEGGLDAYLREHGIPGIGGVDTRKLTKFLRSSGVVRGVILPAAERGQAAALLAELPPFEGRDLIGEVTTPEPYRWADVAARRTWFANPDVPECDLPATPAVRRRVVAIDYGVKFNLLRSLERLGCDVEVVSARESAEKILARKPDGVFLSNGPGDPAAAPYASDAVRGLVGKVPVFGVCMGHQILALALGARTYKLRFGHRGGNQPVIDHTTGKVEISSHNHGYAVDGANLPAEISVTHVNLNDRTVEGLVVNPTAKIDGEAPAFSVQYHPEACPGPHDSAQLFVRFREQMDAFASR